MVLNDPMFTTPGSNTVDMSYGGRLNSLPPPLRTSASYAALAFASAPLSAPVAAARINTHVSVLKGTIAGISVSATDCSLLAKNTSSSNSSLSVDGDVILQSYVGGSLTTSITGHVAWTSTLRCHQGYRQYSELGRVLCFLRAKIQLTFMNTHTLLVAHSISSRRCGCGFKRSNLALRRARISHKTISEYTSCAAQRPV